MMRIINKDDLAQIFREFKTEHGDELREFASLIKSTSSRLNHVKEVIEDKREAVCVKYKQESSPTSEGFSTQKVMGMFHNGCKGMVYPQTYEKVISLQSRINELKVREDEIAKKCIVTKHSKESIKKCMYDSYIVLKKEMIGDIREFSAHVNNLRIKNFI